MVWANELRAYEVDSGKLVWTNAAKAFNPYGSLFRLESGGEQVACFQWGFFTRVRDGQPVWDKGAFGDSVATPIVEGDTIFARCGYPKFNEKVAGLKAFKIPARTESGKFAPDSAYLDFNRLLGKPQKADYAALAFTRVFSSNGGKFRLNLTSVDKMMIWVNGKRPAQIGARMTVELASGWNRVLLRISPGEKDWYAVPVFHAQNRGDYTEAGIAWHPSLPGAMPAFYGGGAGAGSPVIGGENLYVLSEPHDLICLRKRDGKVLWLRRASYFEAAGDEEKKHPAYADAREMAEQIDAVNTAFVAGRSRSRSRTTRANSKATCASR